MLRVLLTIQLFVYLLVPMTAYAANAALNGFTLDETIANIPKMAWVLVVVLSVLSGLASLLNWTKDRVIEIDKLVSAEDRLSLSKDELAAKILTQSTSLSLLYKRLPLIAGANLLASVLAGLVSMFLMESSNVNDLLEIPGIILASYAGARVIDTWVGKFINQSTKG